MKTLKFTCPNCGEHQIEEIMEAVVTATTIDRITYDDDCADAEYGMVCNDGGVVERYQCEHCAWDKFGGDTIVTDLQDVAKWILANVFCTGKTGGLEVVRHSSMKEAVQWIEDQKSFDPEGVARGDYYIDAPEIF